VKFSYRQIGLILCLLALKSCFLAGIKDTSKHKDSRKDGKPLEGRTIFLDIVGRKNYASFEKKLKVLGAVRAAIICG